MQIHSMWNHAAPAVTGTFRRCSHRPWASIQNIRGHQENEICWRHPRWKNRAASPIKSTKYSKSSMKFSHINKPCNSVTRQKQKCHGKKNTNPRKWILIGQRWTEIKPIHLQHKKTAVWNRGDRDRNLFVVCLKSYCKLSSKVESSKYNFKWANSCIINLLDEMHAISLRNLFHNFVRLLHKASVLCTLQDHYVHNS